MSFGVAGGGNSEEGGRYEERFGDLPKFLSLKLLIVSFTPISAGLVSIVFVNLTTAPVLDWLLGKTRSEKPTHSESVSHSACSFGFRQAFGTGNGWLRSLPRLV